MTTPYFFRFADRKTLPSYRSFRNSCWEQSFWCLKAVSAFMLALAIVSQQETSAFHSGVKHGGLPLLVNQRLQQRDDRHLNRWPPDSFSFGSPPMQLYAAADKGQFTVGPLSDPSLYGTERRSTPAFTRSSSTPVAFHCAQAHCAQAHCAQAHCVQEGSVNPIAAFEPAQWLTGAQFSSKLKDIQTVQWERATLGQILDESQKTHRLRIWIDRRVDTSQIVNMRLSGVSVGQSLAQLAQKCRCEIVFMSPVVIFVPKAKASQLLALRSNMDFQTQQLPADLRDLFRRPEAKGWQTFQQPNNLLRQWIEPISETLGRLDSLPHDVWAAGTLPPMRLSDRLLLLSFGFDKQFEVSTQDRRIVLKLSQISNDQTLNCLVEDQAWKKSLQNTRELWATEHPEVTFETVKGKKILSGKLRDVCEVLSIALQPPSDQEQSRDLANQRFTLNVQQQVAGNILQTIAQQTKLTMILDAKAKQALKKRIDLEVRDLELEQLLNEVAKATGTFIQVEGKQILVTGQR